MPAPTRIGTTTPWINFASQTMDLTRAYDLIDREFKRRLGGPTPNPMLRPVLGAVYGSQRLFWLYRRLLPSTYARMIGVPKGYRPTPTRRPPSAP